MKKAKTYSFSRKWHSAEMPSVAKVYPPYSTRYAEDLKLKTERIDWCTKNFGNPNFGKSIDAWDTRWYHTYTCINFRDQEDYFLYVMCWGS